MADDVLMFLPFSSVSGGATPDTAGGRSGLLRGDAALTGSGQDGSGLALSGAGHVEVAHDPGFDLANGSLSFWVRPDAIGTTQGLIGKDSGGTDAGEMSVLLRWDGRISFRLESDDRTYQVMSSAALSAGNWTQVEVRWGAEGMQVLLDGALSGSGAYTGGLSGNDEPWVIGANAVNSGAGGASGLGGFFRGRIDEVALSGPGGVGSSGTGGDGGGSSAPAAGDDDVLMFLPFSSVSGGATPDTAGGRSGLLRGDAALTGSGHDGSGLALSGAGHVEVAHDPGFDLASGALSFWVRPDAIGTTQGLIGKDSRGADAGEMSVLLRWDGRISFRLESDDGVYQAMSSRALKAGEWAHVEVGWGDEGMQVRLDGALSGSASHTGGLSGNDEPWVIGANAVNSSAGGASGLGGFFRGRIDEVTLSGPGGGETGPPATGALSFAGQGGRGKVVDLARDFWADAPRVMPLGDSNTLGLSNVLPTSDLESYRGALWSMITADKAWIDYVGGRSNGPDSLPDHDHLGVSGIRATTVISQAEGHASTYRPDVVLLMLGTNDALNEANAAATVPGDLMQIMRNLEAGAPGVTVLISALPPIDPDAPGYSKRADADDIRDAINDQLPALAASARAEGIDARFVTPPAWTGSDLYDGVHLSAAGHAKLAAAWGAALEEGLESGDFGGTRQTAASIRDATGSEAGDYLRGDGAANRLDGRGGADRIEGGGGDDVTTGGGGSDTFAFAAPNEGADRITDFGAADFLEFSAAGFGGGLVPGVTPILRSGANPTPPGGRGQFLYDRDDGRLFWDADGNGPNARILVVTLDDAPALDADQLLIA